MLSKRILLWGWFGEENVGDDLLLETFLDRVSNNNRKITIPMATNYALSQENIHEIPRTYVALLRGVMNNDTLIIGPGGLFPFDDVVKLIVFWIIVHTWKLFNRKVIFFGIGISEKMSYFSTILWKNMVKKADLFLTRSPNTLVKIGVNESKTAHAISDTAFASNICFKNSKTNHVIVSVANIYSDKNSNAFCVSVNVWSYIVKKIIVRGYDVDLVAFTKGLDDDLVAAITNELDSMKNHIHVINYASLRNSLADWGNYSFSVCMRFHALVLSILAQVPPLPLAYGHKTYSLAKLSGLEDYTLIWNCFQPQYYGSNIEFSFDEFNRKFELFLSSQDDIRSTLADKRKKYIHSALQGFSELEKILDE